MTNLYFGSHIVKKYFHEVVGFNYRMTNLQAAIGVGQLERIEEIQKNRYSYESLYRKLFSELDFEFQKNFNNRKKITWLVSFLAHGDRDTRDSLIDKFKENGIDSRPFFFTLSSMPIYKKYSLKATPNAHHISNLGISMPTYESLKSLKDLEKIISNLF